MIQRWQLSYRADPRVAKLADRHYSRKTPGSPQFVPPGRCVVLWMSGAAWTTSWPFPEFVKHRWPGAWINSLFRKEIPGRASEFIVDAVAATRAIWPDVPELGMISFVDAAKVRHKRDPGRSYLRAGFRRVGTTAGGLLVFQLLPEAMPAPSLPLGWTPKLIL